MFYLMDFNFAWVFFCHSYVHIFINLVSSFVYIFGLYLLSLIRLRYIVFNSPIWIDFDFAERAPDFGFICSLKVDTVKKQKLHFFQVMPSSCVYIRAFSFCRVIKNFAIYSITLLTRTKEPSKKFFAVKDNPWQ